MKQQKVVIILSFVNTIADTSSDAIIIAVLPVRPSVRLIVCLSACLYV